MMDMKELINRCNTVCGACNSKPNCEGCRVHIPQDDGTFIRLRPLGSWKWEIEEDDPMR